MRSHSRVQDDFTGEVRRKSTRCFTGEVTWKSISYLHDYFYICILYFGQAWKVPETKELFQLHAIYGCIFCD